MKRQNRIVLPNTTGGKACIVLAALLSVSPAVFAQDMGGDRRLLDEGEYRSELEEVIVVGKEPEWRKPKQQEQWRPQRFKLSEDSSKARLQWFPEYTKDERDNYNGVRDRTGENAEFKLFKFKF